MDDIIKFPVPNNSSNTKKTAEQGVREATVRRCIVSIERDNLDLRRCYEKGGAWAVAADRVRRGRRRNTMKSMAQNLLSRMAPAYRDGPPGILHELAGYEPPSHLSLTQDEPATESPDGQEGDT